MLFAPFTICLVRQLLADLRQMVLTLRLLHVGHQFRSFPHPVTATAESISGRAPLCRIDIGSGPHPTPQSDGNLLRLTLLVLGFAPVNRLHREGVASDKGHPFRLTEVCYPLPREHTFDPDDQILAIGSKEASKCLRRGRQIFVDEFRPTLIENTDVHRFRL